MSLRRSYGLVGRLRFRCRPHFLPKRIHRLFYLIDARDGIAPVFLIFFAVAAALNPSSDNKDPGPDQNEQYDAAVKERFNHCVFDTMPGRDAKGRFPGSDDKLQAAKVPERWPRV